MPLTAFPQQFLGLLADSIPSFALGLGAGAALEILLPARWSERWLQAGPNSLLLATLAGALLPGCAVSTVPVAKSLSARGAPVGTVAAFLLIAPLISPHTIAMTAVMLGWGFAVVRVALPILATLLFGALVNRFAAKDCPGPAAPLSDTPAETPQESCGCGCTCTRERPVLLRLLLQWWANLRSLAWIFLASIAVAALVGSLVNPADISRHGNGWSAYAAALLGGIPLYVCDGGEVPLTRALLSAGLGPGPSFAFMLASVGTCLPTMGMAPKIIGLRLTVLYVAGTFGIALLGGLLISAFPALWP